MVAGSLACGTGSPEGAKMHAVWHERSGDKTCDAQADATGIAACNRQIGNLTKGFKVVIDVTFTLNGQTYSASTSFTPQ